MAGNDLSPDRVQSAVLAAYEESGDALTNSELYKTVQEKLGLTDEQMSDVAPVGKAGRRHNLAHRRLRWCQQNARRMGLLERVESKRGVWQLKARKSDDPKEAGPGMALVAFSTKLGVAIFARCESIFPHMHEGISVCISSPPYALAKGRSYGKVSERAYADFICEALEPIVKALIPGGSIALNISNSVFERGSAARSLNKYRLVLALHHRFGLHLCDEVIWSNTSAVPGVPIQWCAKSRQQLNSSYEPILVFTNDPKNWFASVDRVLQPVSERHAKFIANGGEQRSASFSDGAHTLRPGSFSRPVEGTIMRNVISLGHHDRESIAMNRYAKQAGLQAHGAPMPYRLAEILVKWLSRPGDLVVDPFAGRLTTAAAAERNGRHWLAVEACWDYLAASCTRFPGAKLNQLTA
ncbi:site-specific DNA-methyltransferase [Xanthomonas euvesicatoria]|uniref:site-specific DNA-methyltransferase n=1 Tax=Xanthomonas euvesicatoria TaxID=456327 RepID=UPI00080E884F|nr:site-specific DNA-methyltransferase [Xanthomonas euvesicatoria]